METEIKGRFKALITREDVSIADDECSSWRTKSVWLIPAEVTNSQLHVGYGKYLRDVLHKDPHYVWDSLFDEYMQWAGYVKVDMADEVDT